MDQISESQWGLTVLVHCLVGQIEAQSKVVICALALLPVYLAKYGLEANDASTVGLSGHLLA